MSWGECPGPYSTTLGAVVVFVAERTSWPVSISVRRDERSAEAPAGRARLPPNVSTGASSY